MIYATGAGRLEPQQQDGETTGFRLPLPKPWLGVGVLIAGWPAEALCAGAAPRLAAGVLQVNAKVPEKAPPATRLPISIHLGDYASEFSVTVAVR